MDELEQKIRKIFMNDSKRKGLHDDSYVNYVVTPNAIIPEILQAIQEAGYVQLFKSGDKYFDDYEEKKMQLDLQHMEDLNNLKMTESEWRAKAEQEGWVKVDKRQYRDGYGRKYMQYTFPNEYIRIPQFKVMTGQEWLQRFEQEYAFKFSGPSTAAMLLAEEVYKQAHEAAKRASGVES